MRYRVTHSTLIVTKPTGESSSQAVVLSFDTKLDLFEVQPLDGALAGYQIGLVQRELKRVRDTGEPAEEVPKA
jgi:hypothetical protein